MACGVLVSQPGIQPMSPASDIWINHMDHWTTRGTPYCCCCSVAKSCLTLCEPMDCNMQDTPVLHYLPEFAEVYAPISLCFF